VKGKKTPEAERLVKRYENRKLYDTAARRYVTLDDLGQLVARGEEVDVVDQKTGDDLTTLVLAQVILEGIKKRTTRIPRQVLARLIRLGSAASGEWSSPHEAAARVREEVERKVAGLLGKGRLSLEEAIALKQDLAQAVLKIVSDAQRGFEGRIHSFLDKGPSPALQALKDRLLVFDTYLAKTRASRRKGKAAARRG
jgi:polyhydroxyalkanoate synthesis repressor PhaR